MAGEEHVNPTAIDPASVESGAIADMIAQMRQLAEEHPEAAQRLAADLTAALGRAGMVFDGQKITERSPEAAPEGGAGGTTSDVAAGQAR